MDSQHWHKKLLGRLMLVDIVKKLHPRINLEEVEFSQFGKPFFSNVFVSLSYSGDIVMVAGSMDGNIGIDIEKICPVDLSLYQNHFTKDEFNYMNNSKDITETFYEMWTKKESVLKADGRGFTVDPLFADVSRESIKLPERDEEWICLTIKLINRYIASISANTLPTNIAIREIFPDNIKII